MACMLFQVQATSLVTPDVHQQNFLSRRLKFGMKPNRHLAMPRKAQTDDRILDPGGYKDRVRQMWHKRAPEYDFQNDFHPQLCEQLVAIAHIKPGKLNLLDVATGTGTVALLAAQGLGPEGAVTAVDVSEAMLAKATEKARAAKLHINCIAQDIEMASFPTGSFDYILCSNGMAYLQHPEATLRKFHSWLREGGKLCFNNPLVPMIPLAAIVRRLAAELFGLKVPDAAKVFGTPEAIQSLCKAAGFKDVQVTTTPEVKAYSALDPEHFAGLVFYMVATFPATPFDQLLSIRQLQQLRAAYMPEAVAMADGMRTGNEGVLLHFTMQWAIAMA
ncbi:hypothetical protein CVIRNUC_004173 [Coccomyxa viridis]|uniref:Methyltransferase domain-containing protein n=1 Tax=Coccomyxa viridis TaxID=1274662 RepID=A0AAV1I1J6_9CHLO|nr:hypothetical protein CVIRNUC_004173 [Coccomyxa viridis]